MSSDSTRDEKPKRKRYKSLKISEISAVDFPAQEPARAVAIMKRAEPGTMTFGTAENSSVSIQAPYSTTKYWEGIGAPAMTDAVDGHQHLLDASQPAGTTSYAKSEGEEYGHEHPFVVLADGTVSIGMAEGHGHAVIMAAQKQAPPSEGQLENDSMTAEQPKPDDTKAEIATLQAALVEAQALGEMTDAQKAHLGALKGEERTAFVAMKADARATVVAKAAESNAVVYVSKADGTEYRKNDDPRLVTLAKRADAREEELRVEKAERQTEVLKARAKAELSHLKGDEETQIALLKAVDTITDPARRTAVLEVLKSHDAGLGQAYERRGVTERIAPSGSVDDKIQAGVKKLAAEKGITVAKAYDAFFLTPEGKELYEEHAREHDRKVATI